MILFDPSEYRDGSTAPIISDAIEQPGLESLTGGDYLVTPLDMPTTTTRLIQLHLDAHAIIVQAKRLSDFPASVGERLHSSLIAMQRYTILPAQCLLVPCGLYFKRKDGSLAIGEQLYSQSTSEPYGYAKPLSQFVAGLHTNYKAIQTAKLHWLMNGGAIFELPTVAEFPSFLVALEAELIKLHKSGSRPRMIFEQRQSIKELTGNGAIQFLVSAPPAVQILASLPGVGETLAQRAADLYFTQEHMDVLSAITQLASPAGNWPQGWGKGKAANLAEALCLSLKQQTNVDNADDSIGTIPE